MDFIKERVMMQAIKMRSYLMAFLIFILLAYYISISITPESYFFIFLPTFLSGILFYLTRNKYKKIKSLNDLILYTTAAVVAIGKAFHQLNAHNKSIHFIVDTISFNTSIVTFLIFLVILKGFIALYELIYVN